ncbi:YfhE family protein [Bacillus sp. SL00103]
MRAGLMKKRAPCFKAEKTQEVLYQQEFKKAERAKRKRNNEDGYSTPTST